MKNNLRGKIREFIASEEGKVGVKGPLTLGVATWQCPPGTGYCWSTRGGGTTLYD